MSQEQESQPQELTNIQINLRERFVQTEFSDGTVERYSYNSDGIFRAVLQSGQLEAAARRLLSVSQTEASSPTPVADSLVTQAVTQEQPTRSEKAPATVLSGKLKTQPTEGKADGKGNPTAWAQFLAHMDGVEGAVLISATFHNQTREIALRLAAGDPITAQGYYHESRGSGRLATYSIFHLMNYRGKPERPK